MYIYGIYYSIKILFVPGMVVHTCNPNIHRRPKQEDYQFEVSLAYRVKPCLKNEVKREGGR
jgi:hypothetical protein